MVKQNESVPLKGSGLILWGDLKVLFDSADDAAVSEMWKGQEKWIVYKWRLFPFSGVHVVETFEGKILYMFTDTIYPLSPTLMKKMLKSKLEVEVDGLSTDLQHAEQLVDFIKNQLASSIPSA